MTDLRLIQYFEAVYRLLSFTKAAEELHLTHSAVTRAIKTLEEAWDTPLFYRTTRSVEPTKAGERLYPRAVELLAFSAKVMRETVSGDREFKIIGGPIAYDILLPTVINAYRQIAPRMRVRADVMAPHAAVEELMQRRADVFMFNMSTLQAMPHSGKLQFHQVMTEPYIMVFRPNHPIMEMDSRFESLLAFPWAFPGYLDYLDGQLPEGMAEALASANAPQFTLYSPSACMNLSMMSDVLTIVPVSLAKVCLESGRLWGKRLPGIPDYRVGIGFRREAEQEPHIRDFLSCADSVARTLERSNAQPLKLIT
jgi:LysR family transcriptional regulator, regulator of abg operon